MRKDRNTILVLGGPVYARPFIQHGKIHMLDPSTMVPAMVDLSRVKLVVFTGGADVHPAMYGEAKNPRTISTPDRDYKEQALFDRINKRKIPMVGICRGAQFLTVMNGGSLIQHVTNHTITGTHRICTVDGEQIEVTSTHHQMMNPSGLYNVLAWAEGLSSRYEGGDSGVKMRQTRQGVKEPEVVYYDITKSLAVQFHPENMNQDTNGYKYFQKLLTEYVI